MSLTGGDVASDAVRRVLGLVEEERYLELLDILVSDRHERVFELVEKLVDDGYDLVEFYHGLLDVLRTLLRLRLAPETPLDLPEELRAQFAERADRFEAPDLVRMLSAAAELESQGSLKRSANPRVLIEMLLLRLSYMDRTVHLEELISALGGAPPPAGRGGGGGPSTQEGSNVTHEISDAKTVHTLKLDVVEDATTEVIGGNGLARQHAGSAEEIRPSSSAAEAWQRWLDAGDSVPKGLTAFLRSAELIALPDGRIEITPLPGPGAERLCSPTVLDEIRRGLEPYLGRVPDVRVGSPSEVTRSTEEEVRGDTMKALFRQEPRLERAVEELDLELMD